MDIIPEGKEVEIKHPEQEIKWTSAQTMDEKLELFNIDVFGSVAVDLKATKISAEGSFKYLDEHKVRKYIIIFTNSLNLTR